MYNFITNKLGTEYYSYYFIYLYFKKSNAKKIVQFIFRIIKKLPCAKLSVIFLIFFPI